MTCTRAQGFLAKKKSQVVEQLDAGKHKLGAAAALDLARAAAQVIVAKGKNVVRFDMQRSPPDDDVLKKALLGPTGNLRAPTLRVGKTLLVGFNEAEFGDLLE